MAKPNSRKVVLSVPRGYLSKYRRKSMFGVLRRGIGQMFKELCRRFEIELVEGYVMPDHVQMCLGIRPKYSVANTVGKLKGKSAISMDGSAILSD
jgi:putative transposase